MNPLRHRSVKQRGRRVLTDGNRAFIWQLAANPYGIASNELIRANACFMESTHIHTLDAQGTINALHSMSSVQCRLTSYVLDGVWSH